MVVMSLEVGCKLSNKGFILRITGTYWQPWPFCIFVFVYSSNNSSKRVWQRKWASLQREIDNWSQNSHFFKNSTLSWYIYSSQQNLKASIGHVLTFLQFVRGSNTKSSENIEKFFDLDVLKNCHKIQIRKIFVHFLYHSQI